ncbi:MAG: VOC family protein [Acidobacteria bacterium]|nr:MAG: VOC family protein [Acidobacteriota bacterium]REJ98420.1 MAG: VOC family protein [Acidobacteriota bacterium]REK17166.1 MAG: VOC family protein [Acidobacteriota bacterium]REK43076.1 MAG: VOC family protein [Acidobacteriota bacterium]
MMNEEFIGLATSAYFVPDLEKGKAWYAKAFCVEPYFDEPFYVGFDINGYELGIQPADENRQTGNSTIAYWAVKDIHEMYKRFIELGATEHEKPMDVGGGVVVAAVKDPWDNLIGLIFNPEFKK